jgi:fucose permease
MSSALLAKNISWKVSYMILAGVAGLNLIGMVACFWHAKIDSHIDPAIENLALNPESTVRKEGMFKQALHQRITQVGAFYLLFYVGTEVTFGSWSFTFLTEVRGGNPVELAQVTSGYWAGLTFGRLFLGAVTAHFGEKRMVALYLIITCIMVRLIPIIHDNIRKITKLMNITQIVVVWQVTAIAGDIFGLVVIGMALGPMFPTTISLASQVLPKHLHTTVIGFLAA